MRADKAISDITLCSPEVEAVEGVSLWSQIHHELTHSRYRLRSKSRQEGVVGVQGGE